MTHMSELINHIYNLISYSELIYDRREHNTYVFSNQRYIVYLNILHQHISIESSGNMLMFLDRHNIEKGLTSVQLTEWHTLYELIICSVMNLNEIDRLETLMSRYAEDEKYEQASSIRDIINEIKEILNLND
jgi:hypothetical protein